MSLDPGEAARLEQIERQLLSDATGPVAAFEWRAPTDEGGGPACRRRAGTVLAAFLIGFVRWFSG